MIESWKTVRITDKATHTVLSESCVVGFVVITVADEGSNWTLLIRDKASTPLALAFLELALSSDGLPVIINLKDFPVPMTDGIEVVTAGTTAGEVVVRLYLGTG